MWIQIPKHPTVERLCSYPLHDCHNTSNRNIQLRISWQVMVRFKNNISFSLVTLTSSDLSSPVCTYANRLSLHNIFITSWAIILKEQIDNFDSNLRSLTVSTAEPQRAVTPGQYSVFYIGDECLGSSRIERVGPSQYAMNKNNCRDKIKQDLSQQKESSSFSDCD
jgi:hypothetical protein